MVEHNRVKSNNECNTTTVATSDLTQVEEYIRRLKTDVLDLRQLMKTVRYEYLEDPITEKSEGESERERGRNRIVELGFSINDIICLIGEIHIDSSKTAEIIRKD